MEDVLITSPAMSKCTLCGGSVPNIQTKICAQCATGRVTPVAGAPVPVDEPCLQPRFEYDYSRIGTYLAVAIGEIPEGTMPAFLPVFECFIHLHQAPDEGQKVQLARRGAKGTDKPATVYTATCSLAHIAYLSKQEWVKVIDLSGKSSPKT